MNIPEFETLLGFKLDKFQIDAINEIIAGKSVFVQAPTGSGKTVIAEFALRLCLEENSTIFYTSPIKALSNQKFEEFKRKINFENIGIITGDISESENAKVVVMTTEILRNMIYSNRVPSTLKIVVLDEVHYINDKERGRVWEETIMKLDPNIRLVCLSATVSNARELVSWISKIHAPMKLITSTHRPVPLSGTFIHGNNSLRLETLHLGTKDSSDSKNSKSQIVKTFNKTQSVPYVEDVVEYLDKKKKLPAIYFIFSRKGCMNTFQMLLEDGIRLTSPSETEEIDEITSSMIKDIDRHTLQTLDFDSFSEGLRQGIAVHHAGVFPLFKKCVELLFEKGLIKIVFATETMALGLNMPAKSVVLESMLKRDSYGPRLLTPLEFVQIAGRAGRRGIDTEGFVYILCDRRYPFGTVEKIVASRNFKISSQFNPSYNTILNLLKYSDLNSLLSLFEKSFANYSNQRSIYDKEIVKRRISLLKKFGYLTKENNLTQKGSVLSEIHLENDLLILEMLYNMDTRKISAVSLGSLIASTISVKTNNFRFNTSPRYLQNHFHITSNELIEMYKKLCILKNNIDEIEAQRGIETSDKLLNSNVLVMYMWSKGLDLGLCLDASGLEVGDFIRLAKQTLSVLEQISISFSSSHISKIALNASRLIDRGIVTLSPT